MDYFVKIDEFNSIADIQHVTPMDVFLSIMELFDKSIRPFLHVIRQMVALHGMSAGNRR